LTLNHGLTYAATRNCSAMTCGQMGKLRDRWALLAYICRLVEFAWFCYAFGFYVSFKSAHTV